jgi:hypothetical protein
MDPAKQKFTKPLPVSRVQGLQAATVPGQPQIQPVPGFRILDDKNGHRA